MATNLPSDTSLAPFIEPLKIPTFDGQPGTYRNFKARFNRIMKKIDEDLQLEYLIRSLEGEPLRIIMMVNLEDNHALKQMWQLLDKWYGNPVCEYQRHAVQLHQLVHYPQCESAEDLKELYYTFTEHINALRHISKNHKAGEDFKAILYPLLPDNLQRKVLRTIQENPFDNTLDNILRTLESEVELNNMQSVFSSKVNPIRSGDENIVEEKPKFKGAERFEHTLEGGISISSAAEGTSVGSHRTMEEHYMNVALSEPCVFCGEYHKSIHCSIYRDKKEFVKRLKYENRCYNCFDQHHIIYFCPHQSTCQNSKCSRNGKHSPFFCHPRSESTSMMNPHEKSHQPLKEHMLKEREELSNGIEEERKSRVLAEETILRLNTENEKLKEALEEQGILVENLSQEKENIVEELRMLKEDLSLQKKCIGELQTEKCAQRMKKGNLVENMTADITVAKEVTARTSAKTKPHKPKLDQSTLKERTKSQIAKLTINLVREVDQRKKLKEGKKPRTRLKRDVVNFRREDQALLENFLQIVATGSKINLCKLKETTCLVKPSKVKVR